ncbi:MAG: keto-deoxy-phosphogluconate aldolase, partial [Pseudomonadota bacterium]
MMPQAQSNEARRIAALAPIIPVLVVEDPAKAAPLAQALVEGGLPALEVTLRTDAALDVIREMASVEGGVVGAGTLLTPTDVEQA